MESYMDVLKDRADQEECYAWAVHEIERKDVEIERLRKALTDLDRGINQWLPTESVIKKSLLKIIADALKEGE